MLFESVGLPARLDCVGGYVFRAGLNRAGLVLFCFGNLLLAIMSGHYVADTCLSCLAQDYPKDKFTVIVCDDGKNEEMRKFCEEVTFGSNSCDCEHPVDGCATAGTIV